MVVGYCWRRKTVVLLEGLALACLRALAVAHVNVASECGSYVVFGSCLLLLAQRFGRRCAAA